MKITVPFPGVYETAIIDSGLPGPTSVIFSGIHGDEVSGMRATTAFFDQITNRKIALLKGKTILLFVGNEEAAGLGVRYVRHNLNREFRKDLDGDGSYERRRATELMGILDHADYFLDLHSTSGPSEPFLFSERKNLEFARKLGISRVIVGWNELESDSTAGDTENYANRRGMGFTFEAGSHNDPEGERNATRMLMNFLSALGQIPEKHFQASEESESFLSIPKVYACETDDFRFELERLDNFTHVAKGTLIATDGGKEIRAEEKFVLVMPNLTKVKAGEDAFFYGSPLS